MGEKSMVSAHLERLGLKENEPGHFSQSKSSSITKSHVRHVWKIESFLSLPDKDYASPQFSAPNSDLLWSLIVNPQNDCHKFAAMIRLDSSDENRPAYVYFRIALLDTNGKINHAKDGEISVECGKCGGWWDYCYRSSISREAKTLDDRDTLTILCDVFEVTPYETKLSYQHLSYTPYEKQAYSLSQQLLEGLVNDSDKDVTLVGADDVRFEAHQCILRMRSPVLRAMFDSPTREESTEEVGLEDVEGEVLKEVIRFLYSDAVKNMDKCAEPLLIVADRYQLTKLKMLCEEHLIRSVGPDTIDNLKTIAEMTNAPMLKKSCTTYLDSITESQYKYHKRD